MRALKLVEFAGRSVATGGIIWTLHSYGTPAAAAAFLVGFASYAAGAAGQDR